MSDHDCAPLERYLSGLYGTDEPQSTLKPGDPQQAALAQFLENRSEALQDRVIIDFGSGNGILATLIAEIWKGNDTPFYAAVDLPDPLGRLSLPPRVHNRSSKITVAEFYAGEIARLGPAIAAVVVRNVLHELDLSESAQLLVALDQHLPPDCQVYVQDFSILPRFERGCAGWLPDLLSEVLKDTGHEVTYFNLSSFSGTDWFALTFAPPRTPLSGRQVLERLAAGRRAQQDRLASELAVLTESESVDAARVAQLNFEIGSIAAQLQKTRSPEAIHPSETTFPDPPFPAVNRATFGPLDHLDLVQGPAATNSGLVAILSHKGLLDFPGLLRSAQRRLFMMGYSQRTLFQSVDNVIAMRDVAHNGASIRLLVARPDGLAVRLRSREPLYADATELRADIDSTVIGAIEFASRLTETLGPDGASNFEIRFFQGVPHASYFIVDDWCFMSLYSRRLSGSRGFCLVFRHTPNAAAGYFNALLQDFEEAWAQAISVPTA